MMIALVTTGAHPRPPGAPIEDEAEVIASLAAQDSVTAAVGERLRIAGASLCAERVVSGGLTVQSLSQYGKPFRPAAQRLLGLNALPAVTFVDPGGPAARAGIRAGDGVESADGIAMPRVRPDATPTLADSQRAMDALDSALADGSARLRLTRAGASFDATIRGTPACKVRFEVSPGGGANASADDGAIQVSSDLVDPARADTDLAPLLAHELGHIVLRHPQRLKRQYRGLLPGFGRGGAALRASEIAADRLSVYLLALAGYDPRHAVTFWTQFGRRKDMGVFSDRTHPEWRQRVAAIEGELARLATERQAGRGISLPADLLSQLASAGTGGDPPPAPRR